MKKREEFAMSLRKKKTHDLISAKRRKIMGPAQTEATQTSYSGYARFEMDSESFEKRLTELCPKVARPHQGATIVRKVEA